MSERKNSVSGGGRPGRPIRALVLAALLAAAPLPAPAPGPGAEAAEAADAAAAPPLAVASIQPVHALLAQVMDGAGQPKLLVPGGASPHQYVLKPSDARALNRARAVFWIGPALESFLVKPLRGLGRGVLVVELARAEGVESLPSDHAGGADPHIWLDPLNARAMVRAMVVVMAAADPGNAVRYRQNGSAALAGLAALEAELRLTLAPVAGVPYLTVHDAYGHFGRRFGLSPAGAAATDAHRPPGAGRVARLRHLIEERGIACVFTEPQAGPALARILVEGTGARIGVLDPLGWAQAPGPGLYAGLMRGLGDSLAACLGARPGGRPGGRPGRP